MAMDLMEQHQRNKQKVINLLHLIHKKNQKANVILDDLILATTQGLLSGCIPHHITSEKVVPVPQ